LRIGQTAIGEFERNLIRERVLAGQQRAKANGVKLLSSETIYYQNRLIYMLKKSFKW